jgi:hypothetical protein
MTVFYAGCSVQIKTKQRTSCFDFFLVHQLLNGQKYFRCKCLFNMHINNTKISVLTSLYQILTIKFLTPWSKSSPTKYYKVRPALYDRSVALVILYRPSSQCFHDSSKTTTHITITSHYTEPINAASMYFHSYFGFISYIKFKLKLFVPAK